LIFLTAPARPRPGAARGVRASARAWRGGPGPHRL